MMAVSGLKDGMWQVNSIFLLNWQCLGTMMPHSTGSDFVTGNDGGMDVSKYY